MSLLRNRVLRAGHDHRVGHAARHSTSVLRCHLDSCWVSLLVKVLRSALSAGFAALLTLTMAEPAFGQPRGSGPGPLALQRASVRSGHRGRHGRSEDRPKRRMPAAVVLARAHLERYREQRRSGRSLRGPRRPRHRPDGRPRAARSDSITCSRSARRCSSKTNTARRRACSRAASTRPRALEPDAGRSDARLVGERRRAPRRSCAARGAHAELFERLARDDATRAGPQHPESRGRRLLDGRRRCAARRIRRRAWDAAIAGWVRARLAGARSATLRADLDKLVLQGIIPDRVRPLPPARTQRRPNRICAPTGNSSRSAGAECARLRPSLPSSSAPIPTSTSSGTRSFTAPAIVSFTSAATCVGLILRRFEQQLVVNRQDHPRPRLCARCERARARRSSRA